MAKSDQTQTETAQRTPVEERGLPLLQRIKDSPNGFIMLTQEEGGDIVSAGQAEVSGEAMPDGTQAVRLTGAGEAALAAATPKQKMTRHQLAVTAGVRTDIPPPPTAGPKRGPQGGSKYPFDTMEVGASFHIPSVAGQDDPLASIQSSLSQAHQKFAVDDLDADGKQQMLESKEVVYKRGTDGKIEVKDGKRVIESSTMVMKPKQKYTRTFVAAAVDASDPNGAGARVWRTA